MWFLSLTAVFMMPRAWRRRHPAPLPQSSVPRLGVESLEDRLCPSTYTITNLGTLGGTSGTANAINSAGQVVGGAATAVTGVEHAYLWTPGATNGVPTNPPMQDLGSLPGLPDSFGVALNDAGDAVGAASAALSQAASAGFFWNGSTMTDLGSLGGLPTVPYAINNATTSHPVQVVGQSGGGDSLTPMAVGRAFLWQNGRLTDLNALLPTPSEWVLNAATGINDNDQVVGVGLDNGQPRAFLWQLGVGEPTDLGTNSGGTFSEAQAVNPSGETVGRADAVALLWSGGPPKILSPVAGYNQSFALGLNSTSQGDVVGYSEAVLNGGLSLKAELWQNGTVIDLNTRVNDKATGWASLNIARGVNDAGQIVGVGIRNSDLQSNEPFLLTPALTKHAASIALTSSAPKAAYGSTVTLTATLSPSVPGSGIPTGTVTFMDGNTVLGTGNVVNGEAVFLTSLLTRGKHKITAIYSGDLAFDGVTSSGLTETIA